MKRLYVLVSFRLYSYLKLSLIYYKGCYKQIIWLYAYLCRSNLDVTIIAMIAGLSVKYNVQQANTLTGKILTAFYVT